MNDAFYKWDGYSYYMRLVEFLPDLSLAYIFAAIYGAFFAIVLWLAIYLLIKILPKFLNVRLEHMLTLLVICIVLLVFKKIIFKSVSLTNLFGLNYFVILLIGSILALFIVWLLRKHNEKILKELNTRITPLVWLFVFLLILAVPSSFLKKKTYERNHDVSEHETVSQEQAVTVSRENRPNIILVAMDALTAQDMQLYGYNRPTTPFISEWAKKSVVFNRAYSSSNWTTPATMSMMTGQRPWTHKIWYRAYYNPVYNYEKNMPQILKESGYDVYSFVQNPYANPEALGMKDSFLIKDKSYTFSKPPESLSGKIKRYFIERPIVADWILDIQPIVNALINHFRTPVLETSVPPELVYNSFLKYINDSQKENLKPHKPFFAWLHVYPPHTWYLPPKPYKGLFGDESKFDTDIKQEKITDREYPPDMQSEVDILRKRYDEFILYSDKQFELFMSRLAETIDMTNTVVILTSDHGESFWHGYQEHDGPYLYEQFVNVPLIIRLPGERKDKINMPVEQIDIAPTILELAGISAPDWMEGRSLFPLLQGGSLEQRQVFSMQLIKNRSFGHPITKGTIAIWDKDFKLIYYLESHNTLLFNLKSDPGETMDLSKEMIDIRQELLKSIQDNLSSANAKITQTAN